MTMFAQKLVILRIMGKASKKKPRKSDSTQNFQSRLEEDNNEDATQSQVDKSRSQSFYDDNESTEQPTTLETKVSDIIDRIAEKRTSVREAAERELVELFERESYSAMQNALSNQSETILTHLKRNIKKNLSATETQACLKLYAFVAVSMEIECDDGFYAESFEVVRGIMNDSSDVSQDDSIRTLSLLCLVCADSVAATGNLVAILTKMLSTDNSTPHLLIAVLESIGLLYTTDHTLSGERHRECLTALTPLLTHTDLEVKILAGEALTNIMEVCSQLPDSMSLFLKFQPSILSHTLLLVNLGRTTDSGLASSKRFQKRDRAIQKSSFREIHDSIEAFPTSPVFADYAVELGGVEVSILSWHLHKRLQFLRSIYGDGLTIQISSANNIVRSLLDLELQDSSVDHGGTTDDRQQDRQVMLELASGNKKDRHSTRRKYRADKQSLNFFS